MPVRLVSQERLPPPLEGYVLLDRLGRGGFGEVWKAEAPGGLLKAIKFVFGDLDDQDDDNTRAAEQERKALERVKKIRHPYILSLERYDIIEGQLIIVMELADRNLWDRFRECRGLGMPGIPRDELLKYLEEAAEALDLMNNHYHIQHLDIKPQNLFLVYNHVKVADFGLAKAFEGVRGTVTGGVTPVYAGPETFEGYVSRYTDQYSLAIVYQELLTGSRPFNGANTKQLLMQHLTGSPDLKSLQPAEQAIIARALSKKPEHRWPSCTELVKALRQSGSSSSMTVTPTNAVDESAIVTRVEAIPQNVNPTVVGQAPQTLADTPPVDDSPLPPSHDVLKQVLPTLTTPPTGGGSSVLNTPLPALVTPRMASSQGAPVSVHRSALFDNAPVRSGGIAPPERNESGVLMPALIVAVGRTGLLAQLKLRAAIRERFGSLDAMPHIRFLYIDTDPEAMAAATTNGSDPLQAREALLMRLNRPAHYMQRDSSVSVDTWMPPGLLYKLPRNPSSTGGIRAFGRLALIDNHRPLVQRVRQELETFHNDEALDRAAAASGLGVRTNRARIYLLSGLSGGTGSGMFLDLAYLLKNELRQLGYTKPETVGVLFIPAIDKGVARTAQANTYAALKELQYFHGKQVRFQMRYDPKESPIADSEGPFSRCVLIQQHRRMEPKDQSRTAGLTSRAMFLELFTPAGRVLNMIRQEAAKLNTYGTPVVQTLGLYRLCWPRPEILTLATRRFTQRILQRWIGKEGAHIREPVIAILDQRWRVNGLELEMVVSQFDAAVREHLRDEPERVFDAMIDALQTRSPGANRMEADIAAQIFDQILNVVGKPAIENDKPGSLVEVLGECFRKLSRELDRAVVQLWRGLVDEPQYRFVGADEILLQIEGKIQRTIDGLSGYRNTLDREVRESFIRLFTLLGGLGTASIRRAAITAELLEQLRVYARKRLKLQVLESTLSVYRGLLSGIPEQSREMQTQRSKLTEIAQTLGATTLVIEGAGPGRMILPPGVEGLDGAVDHFLASLLPEDILAFDLQLQQQIQKQFESLIAVCTRPELSAPFQTMLLKMAREFLDARVEKLDPATVFMRYRDAGMAAEKMLNTAFDSAAPDLATALAQAQTEASILACPSGPDGVRLRQLAEETLPQVQFISAPLPDDIAIIGEYPLLPLTELPQLGASARAAYETGCENSPHARVDIAWGGDY